MAGRLIDADALKAHYAWWQGGTAEMTLDEAKRDFDTIIDQQTTVEAEPTKHGRNLRADYPSLFECSVCGYINDDTYSGDPSTFNYCPNCGSRMDGGENG